MYELLKQLFPLNRSISGQGFKDSLSILLSYINGGGRNEISIKTLSVKSGERYFDWTIPLEWEINDAYIITPTKEKICEFKKNNLHVLNYSAPINKKIRLKDLQSHLYSIADIPNAVPYATSYYERRWGFCISQEQRDALEDGIYEVFIDSKFKDDGELNYAQIFIPATKNTKDTILISSYLCHPSMANNELSGPVILAEIARWLTNLENRNFNYELILVPETIGSIVYISKNLDRLKADVKGGFVLSCIGDEREYSVVLTPNENSLSDRVALHTIKHITASPKIYSFLHRGSDERQYNSALVNLNIATLCRSKFGEFKEYHTSMDDLNLVTENGLKGGFDYVKNAILNLEANKIYVQTTYCEPNLGSRGLIQTINSNPQYPKRMMMLRNFLAFCDGKKDAIQIAEILGVELRELTPIIDELLKFSLIKEMK